MATQTSEPRAAVTDGPNGVRMLATFLKLDAFASGSLGVLLTAAGRLLADGLGVPNTLLVPAGLFLIAFAAWLWYIATRPAPARAAVWVIIALNLLWVLASILLVAGRWFPLTALGTAFILAQAAAVTVFAAMQYAGLRRAGSAVQQS